MASLSDEVERVWDAGLERSLPCQIHAGDTQACVHPQASTCLYLSAVEALGIVNSKANLVPLQVTVDGKPWPLDASGKPILKT